MNELNIKVSNNYTVKSPTVYVDGECVRLTTNKSGLVSEGHVQTDKDCVEITVAKYYELDSPLWFLMGMLFFFISFLGIFDVPIGKRFYGVQYRAKVYLNGSTNLQMKFNRFKEGDRALEIVGDAQVEELENTYTFNKKLKKRRTILILSKLLVWAALIVGLFIALINK